MRQRRARLYRSIGAAALLLLLWPLPGTAEREPFPRPPELEPLVQFWVEIFTVHGRDRTILHDKDDPSIRYETVSTDGMSNSVRRKFLRKRRRHYAKMLENLALKQAERWTAEERRIAGLFPSGAKTARYLEAAGRIRAQRGIREQFREGLVRSGRWRPAIEEILSSYGVPTELAVLPHVESSFDPNARSKAGAVGIWQLTTSTGRKFLRIDRSIDERRDVYVSTHAAARYLKEAHAQIGSWPLTVTAYNHGVNGVLRAQRELQTSCVSSPRTTVPTSASPRRTSTPSSLLHCRSPATSRPTSAPWSSIPPSRSNASFSPAQSGSPRSARSSRPRPRSYGVSTPGSAPA